MTEKKQEGDRGILSGEDLSSDLEQLILKDRDRLEDDHVTSLLEGEDIDYGPWDDTGE